MALTPSEVRKEKAVMLLGVTHSVSSGCKKIGVLGTLYSDPGTVRLVVQSAMANSVAPSKYLRPPTALGTGAAVGARVVPLGTGIFGTTSSAGPLPSKLRRWEVTSAPAILRG